MDPYCCICWNYSETYIHVLRDCGVAKALWVQLLPVEEIQNCFELNPNTWLRCNLKCHRSNGDKVPWTTTFGISCWLIWKQRSQYVFHKEIVPHKLEIIKALCSEVQSSNDIIAMNLHHQFKEVQWVGWKPPG